MTKATYNRKHLTGTLITVLEGESKTTMVGRMVAGRHGTREVAGRERERREREV